MKEKLYKREYAEELIKLAHADLFSAQTLAAHAKNRPENTGFHIAQAVEKSIKAVLCYNNCPIPLTHEIEELRLQLQKR